MHTKQIECYTYEELSPEGKERALEKHREINMEMGIDWWENDWYVERAREYGFGADYDNLCFDIYHGYAYFTELELADNFWDLYIKWLIQCKVQPSIIVDLMMLADNLIISIGSIRERGNDVSVECEDNIYDDYKEFEKQFDIAENLGEYIQQLNGEILKSLKEQEEYLYSDEAVADTLIANECEFDADGNIL